MFEKTRAVVVEQLRGLKPSFASKTPHFNFITMHYFWIIGATIVASIAIFIGGKSQVAYIDSLMFASGANTQAGLNPIDVNNLNGFQQAIIYGFALLSNPISLHTCVVFLRLYWFEKRFQSWAREIRSKRRTISKSKSTARTDLNRIEEELGVNGRNITIVPPGGTAQRITNDGILLGKDDAALDSVLPKGNESDTTTVTEDQKKSVDSDNIDPLEIPPESGPGGLEHHISSQNDHTPMPDAPVNPEVHHSPPTAITFADRVVRSDGMGTDPTNFSQRRPNAEHIAIVERQRNQDNEVLRIPGPRDAERGLGPRRLDDSDEQEDDDQFLRRAAPSGFRADDSGRIQTRQPTITIAEPERRKRDEIMDNTKIIGSTIDSLRFRKPRIMNRNQDKVHEDGDSKAKSTGMRPVRTKTLDTIRSVLSREKTEDMPYLSYTPTTGRNSNFIGLTLEQREELGGIEYRSLRTLALVLLFYFWMFHILGLICLLPYILHNNTYGRILDENSIGRVWWSFWTSNMAFMDVGFSLTADSMNSFATSEWVLMVMWFFIIIGNTGFPVMLRFMIWVFAKLAPKGSGLWEELMFLLDHPRRCFTLLFPSNANWWLFSILIILNVVDLLFFVVLDLGSEPITVLPLKNRVVVGLFQAASTRTAGFSAASMSALHPAMPVLYMIMMYISVFPIAISIRRTNVYEEQSLGVYPDRDEDDENAEASPLSYVGTHLRRQLSFDLWYVFLGFFLLAITEGGKIQAGQFDLFAVLFEIVSAYGTVGLSIGVPNVNASLSSQFSVPGKLIIIAMQIRGRHRGLPYGLDRAVLLPSDAQFKKEAEENEADLVRAATAASSGVSTGLQRQATAGRRSMSRDRNSNFITGLLHPGPVGHHEAAVPRVRGRSVDGGRQHQRSKSMDTAGGPLFLPVETHPDPPGDEVGETLAPLRSYERPHKPERSETSAF